MLITHMLAADPTTAGDVLTYLTQRSDLTPDDELTVATHPNFPTGAPVHARDVPTATLHAALTHPDLPTHLRRTYIDAAAPDHLVAAIGSWDCFTPDELAHAHAHLPSSTDTDVAFLRNSHTPHTIAAETAAQMRTIRWPTNRSTALLDAATITHDLPPTSDLRYALAQPDPALAYARTLATRGKTLRDGDPATTEWWATTLWSSHHPHLIDAAINHATMPTTAPTLRRTILSAIVTNPRVAPDVRHHAARLHGSATMGSLQRTAPAENLHPIDTMRTAVAIAWLNPNATASHLEVLMEDLPSDYGSSAAFLAAIALHPATPADLRTEAHTELTEEGHQCLYPNLTARLAAGDPHAALDVPYLELAAAHDDSLGHDRLHLVHVQHWAKQAWAHTEGPTATLEYAVALHGLADQGFSGTLRELLDTAAAIATNT